MFEGNDFSGKWHKFGAKLTAPGSILKSLSLPSASLDWRDVLPGLIVAGTIATMWCKEDAQLRVACRPQDFQHVGDTVVRFSDCLNSAPKLSAIGDEIVIWIDYKKTGDLLFVS